MPMKRATNSLSSSLRASACGGHPPGTGCYHGRRVEIGGAAERSPGRAGPPGSMLASPAECDPQRAQNTDVPGEPAFARPGGTCEDPNPMGSKFGGVQGRRPGIPSRLDAWPRHRLTADPGTAAIAVTAKTTARTVCADGIAVVPIDQPPQHLARPGPAARRASGRSRPVPWPACRATPDGRVDQPANDPSLTHNRSPSLIASGSPEHSCGARQKRHQQPESSSENSIGSARNPELSQRHPDQEVLEGTPPGGQSRAMRS
jgi:hypothetical protein